MLTYSPVQPALGTNKLPRFSESVSSDWTLEGWSHACSWETLAELSPCQNGVQWLARARVTLQSWEGCEATRLPCQVPFWWHIGYVTLDVSLNFTEPGLSISSRIYPGPNVTGCFEGPRETIHRKSPEGCLTWPVIRAVSCVKPLEGPAGSSWWMTSQHVGL